MKTIHEISYNGLSAVRLFSSYAQTRKNNLRIHYHATSELSLILNGTGVYKSGDKTYAINAGDMFFFRPNEAHCITDIDEEGMTLLNLHVAPYYLYTRYPDALNGSYTHILSVNFPLESNKVNDFLCDEDFSVVKNLFLSASKEYEKAETDYQTICNNYISTIFIILSRALKTAESDNAEKTDYEKILSAVAYIDERFKGNISLDDIAREVGYSRCYFSTLFKKRMGMTAWDYILIKRIEEAVNLIKTTDKNILEIATECGFNNTANFNKIFKKYTNLPPKAFRK